MKMKAITCCLVVVSMLGSSVAFARPGGHDRGGHQRAQQHHQTYNQHSNRKPQAHRPNRGPQAYRPHRGPRVHHANRHARPAVHFRRGDHMPRHYRGHSYRVHNWSTYGLSYPPRGHYWVQVDNDFVLIAAATGIITSIILNNY